MKPASEEEIQATLRWQAEILDLVPAIVCDLENRITFWNRTVEQFYGYSREEVLGCLAQELLQTQFPQPLPEIITELRRTGSWEGELIQIR
jgi:PAS domain S-box-containing protein